MQESIESIIREFIEFTNNQVGLYMDSLSGFAGHYSRIDIKVQQILKRTHSKQGEDGDPVMVFTSYEDPSGKRSLHNRIIKSSDYLSENSPGGSNEQQQSRAIIIFLFKRGTFVQNVLDGLEV